MLRGADAGQPALTPRNNGSVPEWGSVGRPGDTKSHLLNNELPCLGNLELEQLLIS